MTKCDSSKSFDLSEDDMQTMIETIEPRTSLIKTSEITNPEAVNLFTCLLIASIFEYPTATDKTLKLSPDEMDPNYVLNFVDHFGFNFAPVPNGEVKEFFEKKVSTVKLIFPKVILRYVGKDWKFPCLHFLYQLFASINCKIVLLRTKESKFKVIFGYVLYMHWIDYKQLGDFSIFRHSLLENLSLERLQNRWMDGAYPAVKFVPAIFFTDSERMDRNNDGLYSVNEWSAFYDKYLSEDEIFLTGGESLMGLIF
jgi:hypothetical protein